jgi:hypothetical protein
MLRITVELEPGGFSPLRTTIASMRIANASHLADVSDYVVEGMERANPLTGAPTRSTACMVLAHNRRQSVWALLAKASLAIMNVIEL